PAGAVVIDFEVLASGRPSTAGRPASSEYATLGVVFAGGVLAGQPTFRGWSGLSRLVANQPPLSNRFLIMTGGQSPDDYFDIAISFATPASHAEGDVVFNPSVSAIA